MGRKLGAIVALLGIALGAAGCGAATNAAPQAKNLRPVTVAMGYIPNVQFAPFYVAQAEGYYRQAGLAIHLRYGIEPDLLKLAAAGKVDFVNAGGDEVVQAVAQGVSVRYVMTQYSRFPSALFALKSSGIAAPSALRGRSIGIPGAYGASYVGLLVALKAARLTASDVHIRSIGFTQASSVATRKVDAAVGYAMNEPVELREEGMAVREWDIARWANIAGAGIATSNAQIAHHPALIRAFVRATLRGLALTLRNPSLAWRITERAVPGVEAQAKVQRAVLTRALDFWRAEPGHPLGWVDPTIWSTTARLLYAYKQMPHPIDASRAYTNRFIG